MASRNERRKRAKAANAARTERIRLANEAYERSLIVKRNLANPPERNYYPKVSCIGNLQGQSHRVYVCRAGGAMERRRALALKLQGKW